MDAARSTAAATASPSPTRRVRGWRSRVASTRGAWSLATLVCGSLHFTPGPVSQQPGAGPAGTRGDGPVVEEVEPGSALARAGLVAGDVLRGWHRSGALVEKGSGRPVAAANGETGGEIGSPFDWMWFLVEQAPRGGAKLLVERQGVTVEIEMGAGPWSAGILPSLPPRLAREALRAAELARRGAKGEAATLWSTLAASPEGAAAGAASDLPSWIALRTGTLWAAAREWERAIAALRHGLDAASTPRARIELLRALGGAQRGARQFDAARDSYAAATELAEASWGESLELVSVLGKLAGLDWEQGRQSAARERWRRALAITERLAPASLYAAQILSNLGSAATSQSDLAEGEKDSKAALAIVEALGLRSELAGPLNNLAIVAYKRGDLDAAAALYRRSLESREAQDDAVAAIMLNNLAEVATLQGDLAAAQAHLERARSIWERLAPASPDLADALANLGDLASARGDLDLAQGYVQAGAAIREQLQPDSLKLAISFDMLGSLAADRGDLDQAESHYRRAQAILTRIDPGGLALARCLHLGGEVALRRGDLETAARLVGQAIEIENKVAPGSVQGAGSLGDLGDIALRRGDLAGAREHYRRALEIWQRRAPNSRSGARLLALLGEAARRGGELEAARGYLESALRIEESRGYGGDELATTLHTLALVERVRRPELADRYFERALAALESEVSSLGGSAERKAAFHADRAGYYLDYLEFLLERGEPERAFMVQERSRGRTLLAQLAERDLAFARDVPPALVQTRRRLAAEYDRVERQLAELDAAKEASGSGGQAPAEALLDRLRTLRGQYEETVATIHRASPKVAALDRPEPLDLAACRQALDAGTVLLSYTVTPVRTYLFVLSPAAGLEVKTLAVGEGELRRQIELLRRLMPEARPASGVGRARLRELEQVAADLYGELVAPAAAAIEASQRVLIVSDGPLHLLPWGALVRTAAEPRPPGSGRYLVEWKPVHVAASVTVYAELKRSRHPAAERATASLVAFGDPYVPPSLQGGGSLAGPRLEGTAAGAGDLRLRAAMARGFGFAPLPHSRLEVERIAGLFPAGRATTYLGEAATEERAKSVGKDARFIHFATHSTLDDRFPLDSAVVLSIPERLAEGRDNGLLQAWEIFDGVRLDADLVVLSGCESGLGKEVKGEGLLGLTWAFHYAGARSVVASLWKVSDQMTAELMARFYRHLRDGDAKDEALRRAQLDLMRGPLTLSDPAGRGREERADGAAPFFWAAFQLSGDWL
jgi:CHAT domain-containing protein/tetratricopeptide (TPR) repeat protein